MPKNDYGREIKTTAEILRAYRKNSALYGKEEELLEICKTRYQLCYHQIHNYLALKKTAEAEEEIQAIIKDLYSVDLPICNSKIEKFQTAIAYYRRKRQPENENISWRYLQEWLQLYDGNYALLAFRSLEHFARYMEFDKDDGSKVWKYSIDPYEDNGKSGVNFPFFYYFNQMVLKKNIKFISKQYPTGYGKSYSNIVAISWLFGIDCNNDVLLVLGNPALVLTQTKGVVDIMCTERFCKVFPQYGGAIEKEEVQNADGSVMVRTSVNKAKMFSVCRMKEGEVTISISKKTMNLKVISKDTPIDGIRVRFLFLDDVCRSKDAGNNKAHDTDIDNYWNSWWKRNYNTDDFYVVVGGTAYSIYDILSTLIRWYSGGTMERSQVNKFTYLSLNGDCVFIKIPKLDPDTDKSTYPQRFPTEEARRSRDRDLRSFMAMEQQEPMPPETTPFYWDNLKTYNFLPDENRSDYCWATIDPVRVGGDNFSMPILRKIGDYFYLIDCIYKQTEPENVYQEIIDKIVQHNITQLVIERNTDTSLKYLLDKMLDEQGIHYCTITEVYNYEKKEIRITNQQNTIKTQIVFPAEPLYAKSSQMGRFMYDIVSFSWEMNKNAHDDSIDSITIFCERLLNGRSSMISQISTFRR